MGYYAGHDLLRARRGVVGVDEDRYLPVGDRSPVLHRARREVGNGDVVHLFERVGDAEVVIEVTQQVYRYVEREPSLLFLAARRINPHDGAVVRRPLDAAELADDEGKQIRRHDGRLAELQPLESRFDLTLSNDAHVRYRDEFRGNEERDLERRLDGWLVPAGERPSRVGRLQLRRGKILLGAVRVGVPAPIEPSELVIQLPREL